MSTDCIIIEGIAGEDLSSSKYHVVRFASGTVLLADAAGDIQDPGVLGLLQNAPANGEEAKVCIFGICTGKAGGALTAGDLVTADVGNTTADLVTAAAGTDTYAVGKYIPRVPNDGDGTISVRAAAAGDEVRIFVNPIKMQQS